MIPVIDIHCHPSLKIYLCNAQFDQSHQPANDFIPGGMHVDLPGMQTGDVKVILSYQYVPEAGLAHLPTTTALMDVMHALHVPIAAKIEPDGDGNACFEQAMDGIRKMNDQVAAATASGRFNVVVPLNAADFEAALAAGKTIVLHAIEGAHQLGRNLPADQDYLDNMAAFKAAGVCVITLGHFFQNSICDSAGGIPPSMAKLLGYKLQPSASNGLTSAGIALVHWCQDNRVIIDLVHATVAARKQVFDILDERKNAGKRVSPVVFSHSGVRALVKPLMLSDDDFLVLPDVDEIIRVRKYKGVIGLIMMNYWLNGEEDTSLFRHARAIPQIIAIIDWILTWLPDVDNLALGTDLDGFTQFPGDVSHIRHIQDLADALTNKYGQDNAQKICYGNALRVLRDNWSDAGV